MEYICGKRSPKLLHSPGNNQLGILQSNKYTYFFDTVESEENTAKFQSLNSDFLNTGKRQYLVVDNNEVIWCSEYSDDILKCLKEAEKRRKKIEYTSPQMQYRASLVQVIRYSAKRLKLRRTTVHLAVYLLDVFMDSNSMLGNKLNLVALTCLLLASKVEDLDNNVPKLERLSNISKVNSISDFKSMEIQLLKFFEWHLLFPSAATYLEYFITNILSEADIQKLVCDKKGSMKETDISAEAKLILFDVLDLILLDQSLVQATPSVTAAACLAVTRKSLGLCKWNKELSKITGYQSYEFKETYKKLMKLNKKVRVSNNKKRKLNSLNSDYSDSEIKSYQNQSASNAFKRRRVN